MQKAQFYSTTFSCSTQVLQNASEHPLVRDNAADALHSIAVKGLDSITHRDCITLHKEFAEDPEPIVSQSCELAIRMLDFVTSVPHFLVNSEFDLFFMSFLHSSHEMSLLGNYIFQFSFYILM